MNGSEEMVSSNNFKIISEAKPHTIKKIEIIEAYIKSWTQILMLNEYCEEIIFIDCMCNSGVYKDNDGKTVYGTPIRISRALLDVARTYQSKRVEVYLNDNNSEKIEELEKHLPQNERNYQIITSTDDGNALLERIGQQLSRKHNMHFFLLYDPYDASINWSALKPFFLNWGEVMINHMISDSVRAIPQVKSEQKKKKYTETYQVEDISELVPYGSNKAAYETRVKEIINRLKGAEDRVYYVSAFPFFNTRNALLYDLIHCTCHEKGFKLFKKTAWKTFGGKSSTKNTQNIDGQLTFGITNEDEYCYTLDNVAQYLQEHFFGQNDVPKEEVWSLLETHPVYPSEGFARELCSILKNTYDAKISKSTITFSDRRG